IHGQVLRLTGTVELKAIRPQTINGSILNNSVRVFTTEIIHGAATHVQLKVKRLRGEGAICLQTSAKEISPDFINVKGEVTGDIHVEITDASRQTLCNALKLQPDEDGIGATLQPA
ncbi:pertactin-like passenger domain-containing protein, partial [Escherichia coli]